MDLNQIPPLALPSPLLPLPERNDDELDENQSNDNQPDGNQTEETAAQEPARDCSVCFDAVPLSAGVYTCPEHFYCTECITNAAKTSLRNKNAFPVHCCDLTQHGISLTLFEHLLSADDLNEYREKLREHETPAERRVYCVNPHCAAFLSTSHLHGSPSTIIGLSIVQCPCGTDTCLICRTRFYLHSHTCLVSTTDPTHRPSWIPPYSADFRSKRCPKCRQWIQLTEACNHMECTICNHDFCFICMLPWEDQHDNEPQGCPMYQDPICGYDDEGYERDRGIHLYTGRDRQGLDRNGFNAAGEYKRPTVNPQATQVARSGASLVELAARLAGAQIDDRPVNPPLLLLADEPPDANAILAATMNMWRDAQARVEEAEDAVSDNPGDGDAVAALANAVQEEGEAERAVQAAQARVQAEADVEE